MKKILLRVLTATLVCSASLFTVCTVANDDNAAGVTHGLNRFSEDMDFTLPDSYKLFLYSLA